MKLFFLENKSFVNLKEYQVLIVLFLNPSFVTSLFNVGRILPFCDIYVIKLRGRGGA